MQLCRHLELILGHAALLSGFHDFEGAYHLCDGLVSAGSVRVAITVAVLSFAPFDLALHMLSRDQDQIPGLILVKLDRGLVVPSLLRLLFLSLLLLPSTAIAVIADLKLPSLVAGG